MSDVLLLILDIRYRRTWVTYCNPYQLQSRAWQSFCVWLMVDKCKEKFAHSYYDIKYQSHILFQICHCHLPSCLVPPRGKSENCFAKTSTLNNHQLQNIHCTLHCKATFQKPHSVYLKVSLNKTLVLVLNKIDLVEPELSAAWKAYLQVIYVLSDCWIFG